ncbi:ATP-grasp domain-containing protein [Glaciihabitans arcticus]|uniref:biotin carboxylase n=1 Tax=Glaciihabitans arcticus TaxID=2668039 RepID=A0A4V2JEV6_9MICO|nr:biotin carboxylase N-terminal domain-containing protein [Glaciihabitans arcticus]TBN57119.1 ATP-grasp domain-containing protein [Glaciihabitans arcticus]
MFESVLVANRGEIAGRVIRTLRSLGIRSVAVYTDADRGARHVALADAAVRILSYLDIPAVIAAAAGVQAIHPGYGFLSENVEFARACADAGLVFIGPDVTALDLMADKIRAKKHVSALGVPVIPGIAEPGMGDATLAEAANDVGFPLLVKPSAGGGGKGMEVVRAADELPDALATARRVAAAAFGDDTLFLERLVERPRHIEVQVLADAHGTTLHVGERECSLQRRHQKVVEEAPSPLLDAATRARIGEAACEVARSVDYTGAGTVEFLVSANDPTEFFFMEMNTRLQVEHPVTELVTGIDLVEWQLRIAAGEPLSFAQDDVTVTGHAVEARVYAENPGRGFLPTTGTILSLREPADVRVDSGLAEGLTIGGSYDPMLSKVIAHGPDRATALARLSAALGDTVILGLHNNLEFLRDLVDAPEVRAGDLDTGLIERLLPAIPARTPDDDMFAAAALWLHAQRASTGPWKSPSGWRLGVARPTRYVLSAVSGENVEVLLTGTAEDAQVAIGARTMSGGIRNSSIELDGVTTTPTIVRDGDSLWISGARFSAELRIVGREQRLAEQLAAMTREPGAVSPDVRVPMPGTVVAVGVSDGDTVEVGQVLITVEAMKMEHKLLAPVAGTVTLSLRVGDLVTLDQVVAQITTPHQEEHE